MAVDLPPLPDVAAIIAPQDVDRKRRGGIGSGGKAAIVIGTVLILSDGSECVVTAFDEKGNPLCEPVSP
ncbi:MAG: hypothetical protein RIR62_1863 [Pseudomonadota bacterium]|jgi:hypothetical protein